jgi:histidine triad (HIT) family protein
MVCIFCKIAKGEIGCKKVLENDNFIAFEDINPQAKIHILAVTKEHFESFEDTPDNIIAELSLFIKEVTRKLDINESGYRLITNIKQDGGQEVPHLHFHILGGESVGAIVSKKA